MTEKEARKELIRRANETKPTVYVGKDGLGQGLYDEIVNQLKKLRLIKVKVLSTSDEDAKEAAGLIEENTGAVIVDVRGGVMILTDKRTWTSLSQKKF